jgi:hypothetical protein
MANTIPLDVSTQVVLNGSGDGQVSLGPTGFGVVWTNITVAVNCLTNVNEAICKVYSGANPPPLGFRDGTTWGSTGDSTDSMPPTIPVGQQVYAVWSGGDAGTTAYLTITGSQQVA